MSELDIFEGRRACEGGVEVCGDAHRHSLRRNEACDIGIAVKGKRTWHIRKLCMLVVAMSVPVLSAGPFANLNNSSLLPSSSPVGVTVITRDRQRDKFGGLIYAQGALLHFIKKEDA